MTSNIPAAGGVPGISGPDWLGSPRLFTGRRPLAWGNAAHIRRWRVTERRVQGHSGQHPAAGGAVDGAIYLSFRAPTCRP
ncbi:MAG: hypothetical protein HZY76_20360 [Anaerolineae bacterium]|nr:MAG: hypothetical protein HZY76_20360 [Anaerolineae bacterium]